MEPMTWYQGQTRSTRFCEDLSTLVAYGFDQLGMQLIPVRLHWHSVPDTSTQCSCLTSLGDPEKEVTCSWKRMGSPP
eukprot:763668-Hanusia_phi.AAC.3